MNRRRYTATQEDIRLTSLSNPHEPIPTTVSISHLNLEFQ